MTDDEFQQDLDNLRQFGLNCARKFGVPPDDREDTVQQCLLRLWRNHDHYHTDNEGTLKALLTVAVKRQIITNARRDPPILVGEATHVFDVPTLFFRDEDDRLKPVERAINQLRPAYRQVIYLRFLKGLSAEETAHEMNKTCANVRTMQTRAIREVRENLELSAP